MVNSTSQKSPIAGLIRYCAENAGLTLLMVAFLAVLGWRSLTQTPLDAIPDLSDVQVIIQTDWPGRSPDQVEDQITYPLTSALLSVPGVQSVRGQSFFGSSFVYVIFEDDTDIYWARSRVLEYLSSLKGKLPQDVQPILGPDATGVGWVYQYALVDHSGQHSLADLRSFQEFKLRYWLSSLEGVAEVATVGGYLKEHQIQLDPHKLTDAGIALNTVADAVRKSNQDAGGRVLEIAGHEHFIRGRGYLKSREDLENTVLGLDEQGVPILLKHVATVSLGPAMQRGLAELDGEGQVVGGIVVMRYGENALAVIDRVKARLAELKSALPEGMEVITTYDRSQLIRRAIDTLKFTLLEELIVVTVVVIAFLLHVRSALVACITLPVAILLAFIPMAGQGLTANIMSLGGIAVAIGAMVDAAVVMMDNVHRRLRESATTKDKKEVMIAALQDVGPSIFFSLLIITVSFLPVFSLQATEGRLFQPLAYTKTYSMAFAALLSVTLIPALVILVMRGFSPIGENPLERALRRSITPVISAAVRYRRATLGIALLALVGTAPLIKQLGNEFMPPLNEGSILYMPTALPGMSISEAGRVLQSMDKALSEFPEVERVFGKVGRSDSATDPAPLSMVETVITLKPESEWRAGLSWDDLIAEMDEKLRYPGMPNIWWMPIQTRTEMLATGIRSSLGIKVFGDDLATIEAQATAIEQALQNDARTAKYTRSAFAERLTGGYFLDFDIDRLAAARYGLTVKDIQDTLSIAAGGIPLTETVEGRERYAVNLRYARDYRQDLNALERLLVTTPSGQQVPISEVSKLHFRTGAPMIRNENGQLLGLVFVDVKPEIGVADYVSVAKQVVAEEVQLPAGYALEWAGQYKYFERAKARLQWMVPATLGIVLLLLYLHRRSVKDALFVLSAVPFGLTGAFWLLFTLDYKLSVAVWVGIIAMAGLAAELGLLMLHYLDKARGNREINDIAHAAAQRIRPMLMTSLTLLLSLIPVMMSDGTGADVMKRIAAPMVGGTVTSLVVVMLVFPALYSLVYPVGHHRV